MFTAIDEMRDRHIEPIIAHVDRYEDDEVDRLIDYDVMMQLNAASVQKLFKKRFFKKMVDEKLIFFLGSDIHQKGDQYDYYKKAAHYYGEAAMKRFAANAEKLFG